MATCIVTRPTGQHEHLVSALQAQGHTVIHKPLMRIQAESLETLPLRQRFLNLDDYHKVISISANASRLGLEAMDEFWPQQPVGLQWFAVGPASAADLVDHGLRAITPTERYDSEGLLELPALHQVENERIVLWRGVGGRETLASTLRERGASVDYAELYHRDPQHYTSETWQPILQTRPWVLLSSGQALDILEKQVPDLHKQVAGLILPSQRVANRARKKGYPHVQIPASARDEDMLACVMASETE